MYNICTILDIVPIAVFVAVCVCSQSGVGCGMVLHHSVRAAPPHQHGLFSLRV